MLRLTPHFLGSLAAAALFVAQPGDSQAAEPVTSAPSREAAADDSGLTPKILYQFLLAEIAGQRGQFGLAVSAYVDLAKSTRNALLARRAAELGFHTRQFDYALEAARLWNELKPDDAAARQTLANLLVVTNRIDELAQTLERDLATAGPELDTLLLRLNRLLGRFPDKLAVQRLVEQVTVPYIARPETHFVRAQAAANARDLSRAMASIERALELRPNWEMAVLFKAQQMERGPELVRFLGEFLAANAGAHEVRLAYARALVGEKRYAESRAEFRTLIGSFPENTDVINAVGVLSLQLDDPKEAETHFRRLLELNKGDLNPVRFYLGQIDEQAKRFDEAIKHYDAVAGGEHQANSLLRASQLLVRLGRLDEALRRLRQARARLPDEAPRLFIAEAQLLREAGRLPEGLEVLQAGLREFPSNPDVIYEVALAAERMGRMAEAEQRLLRFIELRPESAQGYNALGYSLADRGMRLDEAEQLIDKALSLAPDDPFILDSKGWLLFRKGQPAAALELLRRAFSHRSDPEIAAHIGEVLWSLGRREEALAVWRDAAKAHPANSVLTATIKRFSP